MNDKKLSRWLMIKNLLVFQVKLAGDAMRDLFLSPVSFVCSVIDIVKGNDHQQSYFRQLMQLGHKTDKWLNLFGYSQKKSTSNSFNIFSQSTDSQEKEAVEDKLSGANIDDLFDKIETLLKDQHAKGGVTASAKATLELYLNKISQKNLSTTSSPDNNNLMKGEENSDNCAKDNSK